jgi:hypothetical protein
LELKRREIVPSNQISQLFHILKLFPELIELLPTSLLPNTMREVVPVVTACKIFKVKVAKGALSTLKLL